MLLAAIFYSSAVKISSNLFAFCCEVHESTDPIYNENLSVLCQQNTIKSTVPDCYRDM